MVSFSSRRLRWTFCVAVAHAANDCFRRLAPMDVVRFQFLKKFLHYSKHRIHPELTEDAREHISSAYASLRSKQVSTTVQSALYSAGARGCLG